MTPNRFTLQRPGDVDLTFEGELLAEESSFEEGNDYWTEVRIYRTSTGRYVAEQKGKSAKGEPDRGTVRVVAHADQLRKALMRHNKQRQVEYLTDLAFNALVDAAEKDPAIKATLTEEV